MNLHHILKQAEKFTVNNSPAILVATGIVGMGTAIVQAVRAGMAAQSILEEEQRKLDLLNRKIRASGAPIEKNFLTEREKVELTWNLYIPAATFGVLSATAIVASNRIGNRRAAALAAAYSIVERNYSDYRDKVVEKIGQAKETKVRDEIAQDRVTRNPPHEDAVLIIGTGDVLFLEDFTGRYFMSTMETVKKAQNDTNYQIINDSYASLTDFYNRVGLPMTGQSDEIGWNTDRQLELTFSTALSEDQRPCIVISFHAVPMRHYYKLG
jgi:hypothetical protein